MWSREYVYRVCITLAVVHVSTQLYINEPQMLIVHMEGGGVYICIKTEIKRQIVWQDLTRTLSHPSKNSPYLYIYTHTPSKSMCTYIK